MIKPEFDINVLFGGKFKWFEEPDSEELRKK
jgi:hypothetical protein